MTDAELGAGKTCFIVGPIGDRLAPAGSEGRIRHEQATQMWEKVFEEACAGFGLALVRADKISESGEIPEQIFGLLRDAELVIADVTGGNANVMYELGLRHSKNLPTIQIGEYGRLPFDISTIRTIQFNRTGGGLIEVRDGLVEAVRAALEGRGRPVAATRVWTEGVTVDGTVLALSAVRSQEDEEEEVDSPGLIDVFAESEGAMQAITDRLSTIGEATVEIGDATTASTAKLGDTNSFAQRVLVARELAKDLAAPADRMSSDAVEYEEAIAQVDQLVEYVIGTWRDDPSRKDEDGKSFARSLVGLGDAATGSEEGVRGMLSGIVQMRKLAKDLAPVSRSLEVSLNRVLGGILTIQGWRTRVIEIWGDDVL